MNKIKELFGYFIDGKECFDKEYNPLPVMLFFTFHLVLFSVLIVWFISWTLPSGGFFRLLFVLIVLALASSASIIYRGYKESHKEYEND